MLGDVGKLPMSLRGHTGKAQSRGGRSLIDMRKPELAKARRRALNLVDYERSRRVVPKSIEAMRRALEAAGEVFVEEARARGAAEEGPPTDAKRHLV